MRMESYQSQDTSTVVTPRAAGLVVRVGRDLRATGNLLIAVLQLIQLVVNPALGQQLLVSPDLPHLTFVHDDDLVGALDGRKSMSDDHRGAAFDHVAQSIADAKFGLSIHTGSGFIENQDFG